MGACGSALKPSSKIKDLNKEQVDDEDKEEVNEEVAKFMANTEDGAHFTLKLEIVEGPHKGEEHTFTFHQGHKIYKIGTSDDEEDKINLLLSKDDEVSGEHGKIVFNGAGHVYYYDLESTNGSWVNDVQVEEGKRYPKPLLEGHRIKLGPKTVLGVFETDVNGIEEFN